MDYDPDGEWSPASWLGAYANVLWNDYLNYWELQNIPEDSELTEQQRAYFRRLKELADALVPCLHTLAVGGSVVENVRGFLRELGSSVDVDHELAAQVARAIQAHPIIRDNIKINLALEAADSLLAGAEGRAPELIALVANRTLSERAAAFLDRATRLYLWGFGPEAVVMCASVLEAAYESRFPATEMFRLQVQRKGADYEPYEYEQAALAASVYTRDHKQLAEKVRRARNDSLHNVPNTTLSAEEALRATAILLDRLFPGVVG